MFWLWGHFKSVSFKIQQSEVYILEIKYHERYLGKRKKIIFFTDPIFRERGERWEKEKGKIGIREGSKKGRREKENKGRKKERKKGTWPEGKKGKRRQRDPSSSGDAATFSGALWCNAVSWVVPPVRSLQIWAFRDLAINEIQNNKKVK